jgi:hypothetical protein
MRSIVGEPAEGPTAFTKNPRKLIECRLNPKYGPLLESSPK